MLCTPVQSRRSAGAGRYTVVTGGTARIRSYTCAVTSIGRSQRMFLVQLKIVPAFQEKMSAAASEKKSC